MLIRVLAAGSYYQIMNKSTNQRRQVENEVIFRQANERVSSMLEEIKVAAESEGDRKLAPEKDIALHFLCECADENCMERIILKQSTYKNLHRNSSQFIVLPGHVEPSIEQVVRSSKNYVVVEKYMTPPKKTGKLKTTDKNK